LLIARIAVACAPLNHGQRYRRLPAYFNRDWDITEFHGNKLIDISPCLTASNTKSNQGLPRLRNDPALIVRRFIGREPVGQTRRYHKINQKEHGIDQPPKGSAGDERGRLVSHLRQNSKGLEVANFVLIKNKLYQAHAMLLKSIGRQQPEFNIVKLINRTQAGYNNDLISA
jgi:hypothetical protein